MRADVIVHTQLMLAQALEALAMLIEQSTGLQLTPVAFADLPTPPQLGMIACVSDSTVVTWGGVIAGGGTNTVLAFYNGTNWVVH